MLYDLRVGNLKPQFFTPQDIGAMYDELKGTFQSPKAIAIYAQQCFGNASAIPNDTWIETQMKWLLKVYPTVKGTNKKYTKMYEKSNNFGKVERLLWVAAQARKVHSSACNDALWCIKYSSSRRTRSGKAENFPRGANPLACNICSISIRDCCPAYDTIKDKKISFNSNLMSGTDFEVTTSAGNNTTSSQAFRKCEGESIYDKSTDDFSSGFATFPNPPHKGEIITVEEFVNIY